MSGNIYLSRDLDREKMTSAIQASRMSCYRNIILLSWCTDVSGISPGCKAARVSETNRGSGLISLKNSSSKLWAGMYGSVNFQARRNARRSFLLLRRKSKNITDFEISEPCGSGRKRTGVNLNDYPLQSLTGAQHRQCKPGLSAYPVFRKENRLLKMLCTGRLDDSRTTLANFPRSLLLSNQFGIASYFT